MARVSIEEKAIKANEEKIRELQAVNEALRTLLGMRKRPTPESGIRNNTVTNNRGGIVLNKDEDHEPQ